MTLASSSCPHHSPSPVQFLSNNSVLIIFFPIASILDTSGPSFGISCSYYLGNVKFEIYGALLLQDSIFQHVPSSPLQILCSYCPSLRQLSFTDCEIQPFLTVPTETFSGFMHQPMLQFLMVINGSVCNLNNFLQP